MRNWRYFYEGLININIISFVNWKPACSMLLVFVKFIKLLLLLNSCSVSSYPVEGCLFESNLTRLIIWLNFISCCRAAVVEYPEWTLKCWICFPLTGSTIQPLKCRCFQYIYHDTRAWHQSLTPHHDTRAWHQWLWAGLSKVRTNNCRHISTKPIPCRHILCKF